MRLAGRIAAITGGTRGIGRGIAEAFLREGAAAVVLNGRSERRGHRAVEELGAGRCTYLQGDVGRREDVEHLVSQTVARYGRIDILVNNAGGSAAPATIALTPDDEWDRVLRVNLYATFWGIRAAIRAMEPNRFGRIINLSSVEGKHGKPVLAAYVAAKHAINGLTKSAAKEVGRAGITVNAICPGLVITEGIRAVGPVAARAMGLTFAEFVDLFAKESAISRPNTVEEVAAVAVLLASDEGSGITGALISVDGGTAAY